MILKSETSSSTKYASLSRFMLQRKVKTCCIPTPQTFHSMKAVTKISLVLEWRKNAEQCQALSKYVKCKLLRNFALKCHALFSLSNFYFTSLDHIFSSCWYSHTAWLLRVFGNIQTIQTQFSGPMRLLWSAWICVLCLAGTFRIK